MEKLSGPEQPDLRAFRSAQRNILESAFKLLTWASAGAPSRSSLNAKLRLTYWIPTDPIRSQCEPLIPNILSFPRLLKHCPSKDYPLLLE